MAKYHLWKRYMYGTSRRPYHFAAQTTITDAYALYFDKPIGLYGSDEINLSGLRQKREERRAERIERKLAKQERKREIGMRQFLMCHELMLSENYRKNYVKG